MGRLQEVVKGVKDRLPAIPNLGTYTSITRKYTVIKILETRILHTLGWERI